MSEYYPLLFKPVYKDYLWGGNRIIREYGRNEPPGIYAESWEISDRPEGVSVVANGDLTGKTLPEVCSLWGEALAGTISGGDRFPLLIKLIDSKQVLSLQVHPDDISAAAHGGEAKTEMWYILKADSDACIYSGFADGTSESVFREALESGTVADLPLKTPVKAGDAVFTPGGRAHAIGAGCLILEVQQNSNTTYRIFDWNRVGADGKPRDLHIDESAKVIHWDDNSDPRVEPRRLGDMGGNELWEVLRCPYFRLERLELHEEWNAAPDGVSFHGLFVVSGTVELKWSPGSLTLHSGSSCLVPAALPSYSLTPQDSAEVLRITVP